MFPDPKSRSAQMSERAAKVLPAGNSRSTITLSPYNLHAERATGSRVWDVDGNEYVDFNNNYTSLILGHAHPAIEAAVIAQLPKGTAFAFSTEQEIELAELLCDRIPGFERIRFTNSGSEAVMNAVKAARAHTGRPKIAKCEGAYHGSYDYVEVSLSSGPDNWGSNDPRAVPYSKGTPDGVLDDVVVIPFNDELAAEQLLEKNADTLAAVLFDPVSSRVGLLPPSQAFLDMLQRFCAKHDVLLVFDEVIAFRLGPTGAQGVYGVTPDLTALAKIIGGGFPVGAVAGRAEVMGVFETGKGLPHGGTFNGNPVTMVAGKACMEEMTPEAFAGLNDMGQRMRDALGDALATAGIEGQVTGQGSLMRLHLTSRRLTGYRSVYPKPDEAARMADLHRHLLNAGFYISAYGMVCLSTVNTDTEVDGLISAIVDGLKTSARAA